MENSDYLGSPEAFFDLLKFLIDNLEVCDDEISVFEEDNGYILRAEGGKCEESLSKEGLVSSLIEISPKKITLFCKKDDKTANFLSKLFEERINICYNKNLEKVEKLEFAKHF